MATQQQKGEAFKALHEGDPFIIPNPWDVGTAKTMRRSGSRRWRRRAAGSRSRSGGWTAR